MEHTYPSTRLDYERANCESDIWDILMKMADVSPDGYEEYIGAAMSNGIC